MPLLAMKRLSTMGNTAGTVVVCPALLLTTIIVAFVVTIVSSTATPPDWRVVVCITVVSAANTGSTLKAIVAIARTAGRAFRVAFIIVISSKILSTMDTTWLDRNGSLYRKFIKGQSFILGY